MPVKARSASQKTKSAPARARSSAPSRPAAKPATAKARTAKPAPKSTAAKTSATKSPAAKSSAAKSGAAKPMNAEFTPLFEQLKKVMGRHAPKLVVTNDVPGKYVLYSPKPYNKKDLFFGAVMTMRNYVSYHLFPLYACPELQKQIPAGLAKRKQGKACFNFNKVDEDAFAELDALTRTGFEMFRKRDMV